MFARSDIDLVYPGIVKHRILLYRFKHRHRGVLQPRTRKSKLSANVIRSLSPLQLASNIDCCCSLKSCACAWNFRQLIKDSYALPRIWGTSRLSQLIKYLWVYGNKRVKQGADYLYSGTVRVPCIQTVSVALCLFFYNIDHIIAFKSHSIA